MPWESGSTRAESSGLAERRKPSPSCALARLLDPLGTPEPTGLVPAVGTPLSPFLMHTMIKTHSYDERRVG